MYGHYHATWAHTDHTHHTDQGYICPDHQVEIDNLFEVCTLRNRLHYYRSVELSTQPRKWLAHPAVYETKELLLANGWVGQSGLAPLEPQSRFGDETLKFQVVCPQNGTALLKGLGFRLSMLTLVEPHSHMWGRSTLIISGLSPKRDWGPKRFNSAILIVLNPFINREPVFGIIHLIYK